MGSGKLRSRNHRGVELPLTLGPMLAAAATIGVSIWWLAGLPTEGQLAPAAGCLAVFAAGLVDDVAPPGPRGIRDHLRALASGRVSTGVVKLIISVGAAVVAVAALDRGPASSRAAAVIVTAGSANVWNSLDVRPGRALKGFVLAASFWLVPGIPGRLAAMSGLVVAAPAALGLDLRERAMLGDSGSNLLGFAVGIQLAATIPTWSMVPVAALVTGLNLLAETFTFSRAIEAAAPLRWFDRLGRMPD